MLQIWSTIANGDKFYGYADRGVDYVGAPDDTGIMIISLEGKTLGYYTLKQIKSIANFYGYKGV